MPRDAVLVAVTPSMVERLWNGEEQERRCVGDLIVRSALGQPDVALQVEQWRAMRRG
jgi:hypothetical protein